MTNFDATDALLAGLGVGGFLWFNHKLTTERRARIDAEVQLDCARTCATRVTKPANGLPATRPSFADPPRIAPRTFDQVFAAYGHGIPVPYLRALALRESNLNPRLASGPAWGLLQVIEVVRQDYNQRTGATFTRKDLLDPAVNVTIAASALATIVESYARNHPRIVNLQANWNNPRFVELLTFGWNAGWSERGGVGRVAHYLEARGTLDQTIDAIYFASQAAGASAHLANPLKVAWSKSVAAQYGRELASEQHGPPPVKEMPEIQMPEDYAGRDPLVAVGTITMPSQVDRSLVPPSSPSPPTVGTSLPPPPSANPPVAVATHPGGLGGPINPYDDCACRA